MTPHLYRAVWAQNKNIGDKAILAEVLSEAGFDAAALLERTTDPAIKAILRENTQQAEAIGACGAPTFEVNGEVIIWGQDRIDQVEAALCGWRPADLV